MGGSLHILRCYVHLTILVSMLFVVGICSAQTETHSLPGITEGLHAVVDLDSTRAAWFQQSDSIQRKYDSVLIVSSKTISTIQTEFNTLKGAVDSLAWVQRIDSAVRWTNDRLGALTRKSDSVRNAIRARLDSIPLPRELREKADVLVSDMSQFSAPLSSDLQSNIRQILPPETRSVLESMPGLSSGISDVLAAPDVSSISNIDLSSVSQIGKQGAKLTSAARSIDVEDLSKTAEQQLTSVTELGEVRSEIAEGAPLTSLMGKVNDEESAREYLLEQAKQQAIDHFSGQTDKLQTAMDAIARHKARIPTVASLNDLPKRAPNEMKGKVFVERLVPGVAFQLLKKEDLITIDINVYSGYRFTKRLTVGGGWNERVGLNTRAVSFTSGDVRIYGPRAFSSFKLPRGFEPRVELELMNTFIPPYIRNPHVDPGSRRWVWGAFIGMSKTYSITKRIRGTAMIMVRLFDPDRTSPYPDVVNARFGIEVPIKKRSPARAP